MSKRNTKDMGNNYYSPAKKSKLDITTNKPVQSSSKTNNRQSSSKLQEDILWGDDFREEDLEELDQVVSQAFSQEVNISMEESFRENPEAQCKPAPKPINNWPQAPSFGNNNHVPSPKKTSPSGRPSTSSLNIFPKPSTSNFDYQKHLKQAKPQDEVKKHFQQTKPDYVTTQNFKNDRPSKFLTPSNGIIEITQSTQGTVFDDFENNLLRKNNLNSTFRSQSSVVVVSDDSQLVQLEKLNVDNQKLLNEIMTKEGEATFLRQLLKREQQKLENEKSAKSKAVEEQERKHRAELISIKKEKESIMTQLNFQTLQISTLKEKCKLLETGSVRLIEPHTVNTDVGNRNRINTTINRPGSNPIKIKFKESATQVKVPDKSIYKLKISMPSNPLKDIPESIFETSEPEKPVVDINIVEKIGKRNLPILQEEENFRIFENPELVKPIVTTVDNKELSVQFFLPSLTGFFNKAKEDINCKESIPAINKIIATTRELLLNTSVSLNKILNAMKNDDIRDMNDFYYSNYYKTPVSHTESIWDAKLWHDKERGIETRRSFAVLSYIAPTSKYLGEYIAGKCQLKVDEDLSYKYYSQQLKTYNSWLSKECHFEFLEMILQFVNVMGSTRRAHQFSGLINAITLTVSNVQKSEGFCPKGLEYVSKIFQEIVFSRPLLVCFRSITEMMMVFGSCTNFVEKLCVRSKSTSMCLNNGTWYFKPGPETCTLEIYLIQMQNFARDQITVINITHAMILFMEVTLPINIISWEQEQLNSCKCYMQLFRFTVKALCECSKMNIDDLKTKFRKPLTSNEISRPAIILNSDFWENLKKKQQDILIRGIRFLSSLWIHEPEYVLRRTAMENAFYLFIYHVRNMKNLTLHPHEREILEFLEKASSHESSPRDSNSAINCISKTQMPVAHEKEFTAEIIHKLRRCYFKSRLSVDLK